MLKNKKRRRLTESQKLEIIKRIQMGEYLSYIAEDLNICRPTIYNWFKKYNQSFVKYEKMLGNKNAVKKEKVTE